MARSVMLRRPARFIAADTCARVSFVALPRVRCLAQQLQGVGGVQVAEGLQGGGVVLQQLVAQSLGLPGPLPDHRLVGAGQDLDARRLRRVAGRLAQLMEVGADHVCQHVRIAGIALGTRHVVPLAEARRLQRVHREHPVAAAASALRPMGRDRSRSRRAPRCRPLFASSPPDQRVQLRHPGHRRPAAAASPAPSRPRPSPQRRDGPQPSHHPRTAAFTLPATTPKPSGSQRENDQRPNKTVLMPARAGTTSQQRSTLPAASRGTIYAKGSKPSAAECSPAGGRQLRVCLTADPVTLIGTATATNRSCLPSRLSACRVLASETSA